MNTNWEVAGYQYRNGNDTILVQVDPTLGDAIRVGSLEAFNRILKANTNGSNGSTNGGGKGSTDTPSAAPTASTRRRRRVAKSSSGGTVVATDSAGRRSEWVFTEDQRSKMVDAVAGRDPHLTDLERQVLKARFLSSSPISTQALAEKMGLKHNSEVTLLTRSGLRHIGIRVPRMRRRRK
jgi:hypothetical protein